VDLSSGGLDVWPEAGGVALLLYVFWAYCSVKFETSSGGDGGGSGGGGKQSGQEQKQTQKQNQSTEHSRDRAQTHTQTPIADSAVANIHAMLSLLSQLLRSSNDLKEQFIQVIILILILILIHTR
jgi:hypothetical protein